MHRILAYIRPYTLRISFQLFIKFTGTIMDLLLPWVLSYLIDEVAPTQNIYSVAFWGFLMFICSFIAIAFNIIANRMAATVSKQVTKQIRHDLFTKISYLSASQVDYFTQSSLVSRLTSDTYNIHQMIDRMQKLGVRAPILLLGGILITLTLEPVLTLILLAILPLIGFIVYIVSKKGIPLYTKTGLAVDKLVRKIQETMSGIRVIKALSKSDYEKESFSKINKEVVECEQKASMIMNISNPSMQFFLNLGLTLVILVGAFRVNLGLTQPGKIIAFLSYFTIILNAMMMITRIFTLVSKGIASSNRVAEILDTPKDMKVVSLNTKQTPILDKEVPKIDFSHVSFSYHKNPTCESTKIITDISFKLYKGETLGILGPTGSGKSTIINLLLRFYDVDNGEIRIDGLPLTSIPFDQLYTRFGIAFQNDYLFADTIYENINLGRNLSLQEIKNATTHAQATFIDDKEDNFYHQLTIKGENLSGGQKQRLLISRALAGNPEILILDDSSSALDYKTDAKLRSALKENYKDSTSIIVAQRISSLMGAEKILVLDEGRMIGFGTHQELLSTCTTYQEIYMIQMGGAS